MPYASSVAYSLCVLLSAPLRTDDPVGSSPAEAKLRWTVRDVGTFEGFSSDGLRLFTLRNEADAVHVVVWDLGTGERVRAHRLPLKRYEPGREFPRTLAAGRYFVCETGRTIVAIDLETGVQREWPVPEIADARSFSIDPTGRFFARWNGYYHMMLIEWKTGRIVHRVGVKDPPGKFSVYGKVDGFGFTADGKFFYWHGRHEDGSTLHLWDLAQAKVVATFPDLCGYPIATPDGATLIVPEAPKPNGRADVERSAREGIPGHLAVLNLATLNRVALIPRDKLGPGITGVSFFQFRFAPDGRLLTFWDEGRARDHKLHLWDVAAGKHIASHELASSPHMNGRLSLDGAKLMLMAGQTMHLFDVPSGRLLWKRKLDWWSGSWVSFPIYFTGDSKQILVPVSNALKHFDVATGQERRSLVLAAHSGEIELTSDGRHVRIRDWRPKVEGKKPEGPDDIITRWRIMCLDTGKEVFRSENFPYGRSHLPGDGSALIHIAFEGGQTNMYCWRLAH